MAAFATGCSWSICASMIRKSTKPVVWTLIDTVLLVLALGVQLGAVSLFDFRRVWLTQITSFLIGLALMLSINDSLQATTRALT